MFLFKNIFRNCKYLYKKMSYFTTVWKEDSSYPCTSLYMLTVKKNQSCLQKWLSLAPVAMNIRPPVATQVPLLTLKAQLRAGRNHAGILYFPLVRSSPVRLQPPTEKIFWLRPLLFDRSGLIFCWCCFKTPKFPNEPHMLSTFRASLWTENHD